VPPKDSRHWRSRPKASKLAPHARHGLLVRVQIDQGSLIRKSSSITHKSRPSTVSFEQNSSNPLFLPCPPSQTHFTIMSRHLHPSAPLLAACQQRGSSMRPAAAAAAAVPQPQQRALLVQQPALHHAFGCPPSLQGISGRSAVRCRVLSPEQPAASAAADAAAQPSAIAAAAAAGAAATLSVTQSLGSIDEVATCVPEEFELPLGVLSTVDRTSPSAPEDAYRCPGCTRPECQVGVVVTAGGTAAQHSIGVKTATACMQGWAAIDQKLCRPCVLAPQVAEGKAVLGSRSSWLDSYSS
jgi:hypothetical protein